MKTMSTWSSVRLFDHPSVQRCSGLAHSLKDLKNILKKTDIFKRKSYWNGNLWIK